jgi:hypothetical protein
MNSLDEIKENKKTARIAGICHIVDNVLFLTNQNIHAMLTNYLMLLALGEAITFLWLLIKGVKQYKNM